MGDNISSPLQFTALAAARNGYRRLYPLIFAGREGRDAAYNTVVLQNADIDEFLLTPARILLQSPCRSFFEKCCSARNPSALYIEGLRLVAVGGSLPHAIEMLWSAAKNLKCGIFAASLLLICNGDLEAANTMLSSLCNGHSTGKPLNSGADLIEAQEITKMMFSQLKVLGANKSGRFTWSWRYPTPQCQVLCEKEICDCVVPCCECDGCSKCFFHEKSFILCQMI